MANRDSNPNDIGLRIENAILKSQEAINKHVTTEVKELRTETQSCLEKLPCKEHGDDIKKNSNNLKILVIVLISTGVLGGGVAGVFRLLLGGS